MMMCRWFIAGLLSTAPAALPAGAAGQQIDYATARLDRRVDVPRAAGRITLDGVLDDAAWTAAPIARDFVQNDPAEGRPATFDTHVRIVYDDDAIYFGVFAADAQPDRIIVSDLKKDFNTANSDTFSIVIDTFKDERNGYRFAVNPAGAKWDAQMANEGRETNANWDGLWDVATRVTEEGWIAEIRIPFRTLKFASREPHEWGINFERRLRRLNEGSYWSPVPRIYGLERVSLAGTLEGMRGLRRGRSLRVKPYALGSGARLTDATSRGDFDAGIDVKYGLTSGLTWDFTVNTDFSQVEADEQQVNLSRFSLFFPEKRDFFLENSGIFQFGTSDRMGGGGAGGGRQNGSQDMLLFFSRTIGLSADGQSIPILAGTRLTGRSGPYSIGLLNIQQRASGDVRSTNFTAMRVRRDMLANSDVGAVLLDKEEDGPHYNRVAGVDANFRFGLLSLSGYAARTFSPQAATPGRGADLATRGSFNYQSRTLQFRGHFNSIGERFTDEMGFVPRLGVNNALAYGGWTLRPAWFSKFGIRETRPHWQIDQFSRHAGGLESRYQDWHLPFNFHSGAFVELGFNTNVEVVREPFRINPSRAVRVQPGRYEFNDYFVIWNTNSSAPLSFTSRLFTGQFYDGTRRGFSFGPTFRPSARFNVSANVQVNDIDLSAGAFVTTLVNSRINYNFSTKVFLNALLQYSTDSRQWSSNLRLNVIHRPLSDLFFVYNERRDERTGALVDRAVIAKMTYLVAF